MYTLIIADDEEIERKALNLLIQKEFPEIQVVALAENGIELVSMVELHRPDIAIVDVNMPGISGIDAVDLLRNRDVNTRFIINTAYSDFTYVQQALFLKVDAYILKPQKRADTIEVIKKLCRSIDENRSSTKSQQQIQELFWRIRPVLESEIMYSVFMGEPSQESFSTWCEMHNLQWNAGIMVTLAPTAGSEQTLKEQEKDSLHSFLRQTLGNSCFYLASINETSISLLVLLAQTIEYRDELEIWLADVLHVLLEQLSQRRKLRMIAGAGQAYATFGQMSESYRESFLALKRIGRDDVRLYRPNEGTGIQAQLAKLSHSIITEATHGRLQEIDHYLKCIEDDLIADSTLIARLWQSCKEEVTENAQCSIELRAFLRLSEHTLRQETSALAQYAHLQTALHTLSGMLANDKHNSMNPYIAQALTLIETQYHRDLSLESVSAEIGISPYYLSHLLKAELGKTFVEYLTQVRMQEALRLARSTRMVIKEIAEQTGYPNPTYFCRVFKKYTGHTIGEIRGKKG